MTMAGVSSHRSLLAGSSLTLRTAEPRLGRLGPNPVTNGAPRAGRLGPVAPRRGKARLA